jgi:hypothetical protein
VIKVSVLNRSDGAVTDDQVRHLVRNGLQPQVSEDFAPIWRINATLKVTEKPEPGSWWLVILADTDNPCWQGYHCLTPEELPLARVFANTAKKAGNDWTVAASHELLEMLVDPDDNRMVCDPPFVPENLPRPGQKKPRLFPGQIKGRFYALEVCDPCSSDDCGYRRIGHGPRLSDFVLPSWFQKGREAGYFDFNHRIKKPFELAEGGYVGIYSYDKGWQLKRRGIISRYRKELLRLESIEPKHKRIFGRLGMRRIARPRWASVALV